MSSRTGKLGLGWLTLVLLAFLGCGDADNSWGPGGGGGGGFKYDGYPKAAIYNHFGQYLMSGSTTFIGGGGLQVGQVASNHLVIRNIGTAGNTNRGLTIVSMALEYTPTTHAEDGPPAFRCVVPSQDNLDCSKAKLPAYLVTSGENGTRDFEFAIQYRHFDDEWLRVARLVVKTNDANYGDRTYSIRFQAVTVTTTSQCPLAGLELALEATPVAAQFDATPIGTTTNVALLLTNMTGEEQQVTTVDLSTLPSDRFRVWLTGVELPTGVTNTGGPFLALPEWGKASLQVQYSNVDGKAQAGMIVLGGASSGAGVVACIPVQVSPTEIAP